MSLFTFRTQLPMEGGAELRAPQGRTRSRLNSTVFVTTSYALEAGLPVVRTIALAKLLPQDQFGLAVTALATVTMVEMSCDIGLAASALRGPSTSSRSSYFGTLHSLALMRSVAMIFLALGLLGIQQVAFDSAYGFDLFTLTLLILALRGFENLTLKQYARQYDFRPDGILMSGAQIVWTVGSVAAALLTHSYAAMFWGQLASVIWIAGYSNWVAPDRFDLDWNPKVAQEALRFGAPLVPNGLVSAVSSSDRFLIGSFLGARPVAVYSVAISLATLPRSILYRVATSVLVSHFTNISSDSTKFRAFYHQWIALVAALATLYALAIILLGDAVIRLAFGAAYVPSSLLISLIAIVVFIKFMFLVPVPAAYALGETKFVLLGSALSAVSVVPAALLLLLGMRSLEAFILAVVAVETIGLMIYINLTAKRHQLRRPLVFAMVILPLIGLSLLACSALFHRVA